MIQRHYPVPVVVLCKICKIPLYSCNRLLIRRKTLTVGASVHSTTGSRGVRISGSNAGYTMFRGSVKSTGYPLHSPVSPSLPFPCVTVCRHISTGVCPSPSAGRWNVSAHTCPVVICYFVLLCVWTQAWQKRAFVACGIGLTVYRRNVQCSPVATSDY